MRITAITLLLAALPAIASARCVTADDLAQGITFKREDGRTGLIQAKDGALVVNYATNPKGAWQDLRVTERGIYEISRASTPTEDYIVGGGPGGYFTYKRSGTPPEPMPGKIWKTKVSQKLATDDGTEFGSKVARSSYQATYSFLPVTEAKLSGCTYRIQPVEVQYKASNTDNMQRFIYFPDLGFGLETRTVNHKNGEDVQLGLTALKAMQ